MTIATDDNTGEVILINASDIEPKAPPTAAELIAEVEARYPDLDASGFLDGSRTPSAKLSAAHCGFATAIAFIRAHAAGAHRQRQGYYSYVLKHTAEKWTETDDGPGYEYVSNGAMIAAAIASGWSVRRVDGINAWLKPPLPLWRRPWPAD
ncbi:MAG TPA: hypothetical protein VNY10_24255 [Roseiarcus sp.]|nr:hypothetical protein [Roseiarcus sp.]